MVILVTDEGGGPPPQKFRNYPFLGKIFKFQGGSGPPVPPSGSAHDEISFSIKKTLTDLLTGTK